MCFEKAVVCKWITKEVMSLTLKRLVEEYVLKIITERFERSMQHLYFGNIVRMEKIG
jgi:hypothetical protein